jgi:hypothetical protein
MRKRISDGSVAIVMGRSLGFIVGMGVGVMDANVICCTGVLVGVYSVVEQPLARNKEHIRKASIFFIDKKSLSFLDEYVILDRMTA